MNLARAGGRNPVLREPPARLRQTAELSHWEEGRDRHEELVVQQLQGGAVERGAT